MIEPTVQEVQEYCLQRKNGIDPLAFVSYYQSVGWKVGKTRKPMVSWQAAVRTWERSRKPQVQTFIDRHTSTDWAEGI